MEKLRIRVRCSLEFSLSLEIEEIHVLHLKGRKDKEYKSSLASVTVIIYFLQLKTLQVALFSISCNQYYNRNTILS